MKLKLLTVILSGVIGVGLFSFLSAGNQKTAKISVLSHYSESMEYVGDDETEEPEPEPVPEVFTVKAGDSVCSDSIRIVKISDSRIDIEMFMEYISNSDRTPKHLFSVEKGETLTIWQYGLCDATQSFTITYIE